MKKILIIVFTTFIICSCDYLYNTILSNSNIEVVNMCKFSIEVTMENRETDFSERRVISSWGSFTFKAISGDEYSFYIRGTGYGVPSKANYSGINYYRINGDETWTITWEDGKKEYKISRQ
jgi:hypothetical protein